MAQTRTSVAGAFARGLAAGLAGTAVMTAYQEAVARARGRSAVADTMKEPRTWAEAPAPAQLAKKVSENVLNKRVTKRQAPVITTAVHWSYGAVLGAAYGLAAARRRPRPLVSGLAFGTGVWGLAYAALKTLGIDLSYHLFYGLGVAAAYEALD